MMRLPSSTIRRAAYAALRPASIPSPVPAARGFSSTPISSAAPATSIASILSAARSEWPLKDAVKFAKPVSGTDKSVVWTFSELVSHVGALASGLSGAGYVSGDRVVSVLAAHTAEAAVLLLACAKLGVTVVSVPSSGAAEAISQHAAKALFVPGDRRDDSILSSVNAILHDLDPSVALRDSAGIAGLTAVTGRSFRSMKFPSLRHVVHTGPDNVRAAITFRSLLVYNDDPATALPANKPPADAPPLVVANNTAASELDIVKAASEAGQRLALSADHSAKNGCVIVNADGSSKATSHAVAALMHQALWVCPHPDAVDELKKDSNSVVV